MAPIHLPGTRRVLSARSCRGSHGLAWFNMQIPGQGPTWDPPELGELSKSTLDKPPGAEDKGSCPLWDSPFLEQRDHTGGPGPACRRPWSPAHHPPPQRPWPGGRAGPHRAPWRAPRLGAAPEMSAPTLHGTPGRGLHSPVVCSGPGPAAALNPRPPRGLPADQGMLSRRR